ncbi:hypothetical protein LSCM1_01732 [Leishmania martiniquensis]|uniref:Uncharacterized protein n=1 Tax=Leishmania martiniquensis TaxID=1580590 RepID=A0A836H5P6_9TRYP|nr:hypothetical protein LSCM1_01732 [Leishmania martiniquensis]
MFDAVALPFADSPLSATSSGAEDVRWMAFARELVLQDLRSTPLAMQVWADAITHSLETQQEHYQSVRDFLSDMQSRLARDAGEGLPSPISGTIRHTGGDSRGGLLDPVEVAAPPLTLWRSTVPGDPAGSVPPLSGLERSELESEEEEPILFSSSRVTPSETQLTATQASLDAVFFEALLSQELSVTLWQSCGAPQEALQCALDEMQRLDRSLCEEDAVLRYLNTTRYAEQRTYKRRRTELESQLRKTREKVSALEKLLGFGTAALSSGGEVRPGKRLRTYLLE